MQIQQWGEKSRKNTEFITFRTFVDKIGFLHLGIKEGDSKVGKHADLFSHATDDVTASVDAESEKAVAFLKEFEAIQLDSLSPKEALDLLYRLKKDIGA